MSADKSSINRERFLKSMELVRPALATKNYLPALTHICFAGGWATAYNDISAIMVRDDSELERCIPGDLLIRALGSFSGESVLLQPGKDGAFVIKSGRSQVTIPTMPAAAFPFSLPDDDAPELRLDGDILKGISRCLLSVGNSPNHPAQAGVTLDMSDDGYAVLFSTDSGTISRYETKTKIKLPADAPVILPTFFCEQLTALRRAFADDDMALVLLPGALLVEFGKAARLFTKTLHDLVPIDFPRVVEKHVKLSGLRDDLSPIPDAFEASLGRALLVMGQEVDKRTQVTVADGVLRLASSCGMGDANDSLPFEAACDPPQPFFVDPSLLARASKVCALVGFMERVVVLSDEDCQFVHLVAHSSK